MKKSFAVSLLAFALAACGGSEKAAPEVGGARVNVRGNSANWNNGTVDLTIQKVGAPTLNHYTLAGDGNYTWKGTFDNLPQGAYQFCATATWTTVTFGPQCAQVTVQKNKMADVTLVLQQSGGQQTVNTNSPLITGLVLSDGAPSYGETITMSAVATDPSAVHALGFAWTAVCDGTATVNTLADANHTTATLTSDCRGTERISLTVTDVDQNISSVVEFALTYSPQGANVSVTLNRWPDILGITTPDAQLLPGDRTTITVTATDADDASLSYAWTVTCGGNTVDPLKVFNAPDMATTGFYADPAAVPVGDCTATVKVSDNHGGSVTGSIIIHVRNALQIQSSSVSATMSNVTAVAGGVQANGNAKSEGYVSPMTMFGHAITMADIASIAYDTNKAWSIAATPSKPQDWALVVYTQGTQSGWYGRRFGAEPYFAMSLNDPANTWNTWSTASSSNVLRFYESTGNAFFGAYNDPDLAGFLAADATRASQPVLAFSLQTGSAWAVGFDGELGALRVTLTSGESSVVTFTP